MKFLIQKDNFEEILSLSSRFTSSKISSIQSIQGAHIKTDKDSIYITTTNLNDFYFAKEQAKIEEEGEIVFDNKKAIEFISLLSPGEIEVVLQEGSLVISQGKNKGYFQTYGTADFPEKPKIEGKEYILDKELVEKLSLIFFSASKDETRPVLTGVFFGSKGGEGEIVSTDGFRLSLLHPPKGGKDLPGFIIPAQVLQEVVRQVKKSDAIKLSFSETEKIVAFTVGEAIIYSRAIDGEFPPYEKVIPKTHTTSIVVNKDELLRNIKLISVFAREQGDIVLFDIQKEGLLLKPKATKGNETQAFMEVNKHEGSELKIAFNYRYVLDFLNTIPVEEIVVELTQSTAPAIFRDPKSTDFLHIIMPLRTEETTE